MKTVHRLLFSAIALFAFSLPTTASAGSPGADTTFWVGDSTAWHKWGTRHPVVEFGYGIDQMHHKRLGAAFPSTGMMEFRAGYLLVDTLANGLLSVDQNFLVGSWYNSNLGGETGGPDEVTGKLARFGLGHGENYGYDLGGSSIVPYFQSTAAWTELTTGRPANLSQDDIEILDRYEGTFRFGASAESGIRANIGRTISLSGGYEAGVVYPRIVFWELAGSYLVVGAANGVVSWFGDDLVKSSPTLGPVFLFLIRSGVTWGVYQLWREDMNWPFASETPLTHETLKFGLSFTL